MNKFLKIDYLISTLMPDFDNKSAKLQELFGKNKLRRYFPENYVFAEISSKTLLRLFRQNTT